MGRSRFEAAGSTEVDPQTSILSIVDDFLKVKEKTGQPAEAPKASGKEVGEGAEAESKTPAVKETFVTRLDRAAKEAAARQLRKRGLKAVQEDIGKPLSSMEDMTQDLHDWIVMGADLLVKGVTPFGKWAKAMLDQVGPRLDGVTMAKLFKASHVYMNDNIMHERRAEFVKKFPDLETGSLFGTGEDVFDPSHLVKIYEPADAGVAKRIVGEKVEQERRYYLSSLKNPTPQRMAEVIRGHWGIENRLHGSLDMSFNEDRCRIRQGHAAENFSRLRRVALNLLRQDQSVKVGVQAKRHKAGWDESYLLKILGV